MEHEQKRREQLEKLFNRTKEQVDEELYLIEELKKIEVRKKEREKKQQEVDKLLTAVGDLENAPSTSGSLQNGSLLLKNRLSLSQKSRSSSSRSNKQKSRDSRGNLNSSWSQSNGADGSSSLNNSGDGPNLNQSASPSGLSADKKKNLVKVILIGLLIGTVINKHI